MSDAPPPETATPPDVGDRFVWMAAGDGFGEMTYPITRVVESCGAGRWLVAYEIPAVDKVPAVFREAYGEAFGQASTSNAFVERRDGRWINVAEPLAVAEGAHLWFVPKQHGFPNISGEDESCAKCGKMRGPVNESRPCPGVQKRNVEDWFR